MSRYEKGRELSDEVLQSIYKPRAVDYIYRCPRCGQEVCRCGTVSAADVKAGMDRIVLTGTIVDADQPVEIETKYGRTLLARAFLEDPSGRVRLNLWGEHAPMGISGSIVRVENAFASRFPGEVEVNLGGEVLSFWSSPPTSSQFSNKTYHTLFTRRSCYSKP